MFIDAGERRRGVERVERGGGKGWREREKEKEREKHRLHTCPDQGSNPQRALTGHRNLSVHGTMLQPPDPPSHSQNPTPNRYSKNPEQWPRQCFLLFFLNELPR